MAENVIVLGAGGHSKVLIDVLRLIERRIIGLVAPDKVAGDTFYGVPVLGGDEEVLRYSVSDVMLVNGLGALPGMVRRWSIAEEMRNKGYQFVTVVHPSAIVASGVTLQQGVQVMAGAIIQSGSSIGQDSIINTGTVVDHDCKIESGCHVASGAVLSGGVWVGRRGHVGAGTVVLQNCSIGERAVIAAGSVIYRDIPEAVTVIQKRATELITTRE